MNRCALERVSESYSSFRLLYKIIAQIVPHQMFGLLNEELPSITGAQTFGIDEGMVAVGFADFRKDKCTFIIVCQSRNDRLFVFMKGKAFRLLTQFLFSRVDNYIGMMKGNIQPLA